MKDSKSSGNTEDMLAAVRVNWRLWTIIQSDLLDPECLVPDEVRANVLSLAQFIDNHTLDVLARPRADKLDVLIAINRELAGGLYTTPAGRTGEGGDCANTGETAPGSPKAVAKATVAVSA